MLGHAKGPPSLDLVSHGNKKPSQTAQLLHNSLKNDTDVLNP